MGMLKNLVGAVKALVQRARWKVASQPKNIVQPDQNRPALVMDKPLPKLDREVIRAKARFGYYIRKRDRLESMMPRPGGSRWKLKVKT